MTQVHSFAPLSMPGARVLILGSMPGKASLSAQQYYAHPRNAFWSIMGELCGFDPQLPYQERIRCLTKSGIALWDVAQMCARESSLDSDIVNASVVPNDFAVLLRQQPDIQRIGLNGGKAYELYRRHVQNRVHAAADIPAFRLPSTSPAHAGMPFSAKLHAWRQVLEPILLSHSATVR